MKFDPSIQIQNTHVRQSAVQVHIPAFVPKQGMSLRIGLVKKWFSTEQADIYGSTVYMRLILEEASDKLVLNLDAELEQRVQVQGYEGDALQDVLERRLNEILLPYTKAHVAQLLAQTGYQAVQLPTTLPGQAELATEVDALTRVSLAQASEKSP